MLGGGRHCRRCRLGVGVGVGLVDPGVDTKLVELSEELIARGFVAFGGHGLFSFCGNTRRFSGRDARMGYIVEVDGPIGGGGCSGPRENAEHGAALVSQARRWSLLSELPVMTCAKNPRTEGTEPDRVQLGKMPR